MDSPLINFGSFCSGVGLLDEGFRLACEYRGIRTRSVFASEWDAYAASVLRSRMEDASLESCPIWCGDLRDFPAERFRGVVDAAVFGFPCTDISCAGKRQGLEGTRSGLFYDIMSKVRDMGCWLIALENVAAITTLGLDSVLGEMAESGFDAEWCCLTAAEVGASHKRNRWFCVGVRRDMADSLEFGGQRQRGVLDGQRTSLRNDADRCDQAVADTSQRGLGECGQPSAVDGLADVCDEVVGDSDSARLSRRSVCGSERGSERLFGTPSLYAPGPSDPRWSAIIRDYPWLAPAISKEEAECLLHRVAHGFTDRLDGGLNDHELHKLRAILQFFPVSQRAVLLSKMLERTCGDTQTAIERCFAEASPKETVARWREMCALRINELLGPSPYRLQRSSERGDSLSAMSQEAGHTRGEAGSKTNSTGDMLYMREGISTKSQKELKDVRESGVQIGTGKDECAQAMDASRADRLRCVGNGVVVLQAACAFATLLSRFINDAQ